MIAKNSTPDMFPEAFLAYIKNGRVYTDSLTIAKHFHKRHDNVLRDIEKVNLERANAGLSRLNFEAAKYLDKQKKPRDMFEMDRKSCFILIMQFNGKNAVIWRDDFYNAFEWMENYINALINRHASAFSQLKPKLVQIEAGDKENLTRAQIALQTGHKCLGSITAGRKRARDLGLDVKPARSKKTGAA